MVREIDPEAELWGLVFEPLRADPQFFRQVRVDDELGTIVWPNGAWAGCALRRHSPATSR
jgi:hypothetical protein